MLTLIETRLGINPPTILTSPSDNWHGYLMSWNGAFWWRSRTWLCWTLYSKGWFCRKLRRRPWSKFCIIENRQESCHLLHSLSETADRAGADSIPWRVPSIEVPASPKTNKEMVDLGCGSSCLQDVHEIWRVDACCLLLNHYDPL